MKLLRFLALLGSIVPALLWAFDPNANGNIYATAVQADGKVILGGGFTAVQPPSEAAPVTRKHLARFNADGTLDASFSPVFDGDVVAVVVQSDGRIVVAGKFTTAQGTGGSSAVARSGLARLNADGTLDTGFDPRPTGGSTSTAQVAALALDASGNILIGGSFTTLQPGGTGATVARGRLARLTSSGAVDTSFAPSFNNLVFTLAVQTDGKILVGGGFTTVQYGSEAATTATRLARLNTDGSLDASFAVLANNRVLTLALESDGSILAGGDFTAVRGSTDSGDVSRSFLVRFRSDGVLDSFEPRPDASVSVAIVQRDGKILVGGDFGSFLPVNSGVTISRAYLARLNADGAVDTSFAPSPNAAVRALGLQSDGRILAGGLFTRFFPSGVTDGVLRNHAARLLASGDLDGSLASAEDGSIAAAAVESSGSVIVGGTFNTLGGLTRQNLARILADGTIDPAFNPVLDGAVSAVAIQSDGRIVIGGSFTKVGGTKRTYLARLNADGSLDTSYAPGPNGAVFALFLKSDGSLLVGGNFSAWYTENDSDTTTDNTTDNVSRSYLAEIDSSGKVTSLNWSVDSSVYAITQQTDGKFLLGGAFSSIKGTTRQAFARVGADGTVDSAVNPAPNGSVRAIAVQADGKILFGGVFSVLQLDDGEGDDDDRDGLTNDDADRRNLARLNADGTLDKTYNPGADAAVTAIATLADGRAVLGGYFTHVGPSDVLARKYLAVIGTTGTPDSSFTTQTNDRIYAVAKAANGTLYFVGRFTAASSGTSDTLAASNHILRLASDGTFQSTWTVTASNTTGARVAAIAPQTDGRVLVGGSFTNLGGQTTTNLARFSAAGVRDTSFTTSADGTVNAVLVQSVTASSATKTNTLAWFESGGAVRTSFARGDISNVSGRINAVLVLGDGSLLVGGAFTVTGSSIKHLAHFRANGTLDTAFDLSLDASVAGLALQPDGKIAVGGAFTSVGGYTRTYLARLNSDLSVDVNYAPPALNSSVAALVVQSDNAIVVGGSFTSVEVDDGQNDDDDSDGVTTDDTGRAYIARFKSDGTLDKTYDPKANGAVAALLLMPDGKVLAGGSFTTFAPNGGSSTSAAYIALLNTDGSLDTSLAPTPNGPIMAVARQADGKILFGGSFTTLQLDDGENDDDDGDGTKTDDADRHYLARLNADYSLDKTFKPEADSYVQAIAVHADGRIFIGGAFTKLGYDPKNTDSGVGRSFVAALTSSGAIDTSFNPAADNYVYTITLPADGSLIIAGAFGDLRSEALLYVGGEFSAVGGVALPRLARLTVDGSPDSSFNPAPNNTVYALGAQADGSVLVAGNFTTIAGATRNRLARFSSGGALDGSFSPSVDGAVRALAVTTSGAIVIGGEFANVAGSARSRLARLTASGALDGSFSPSVNGPVRAVAALPDGRILIGGEFTSVAGQTRNNLARLNADGSLDTSFNPAPDGGVYALSARVDGTVLVGGAFTNIAGQGHAKLALLKSDGSLDTTFAATANASVHALTGLLDGRAFVGGEFTTLGGAADYLLSRASGTTSGAYSFSVGSDLRSASWTLSGSAADFVAVTLSYSTNSNLWTTLGTATPSSDGKTWAWSGSTTLPSGANYLLRARAVTAGAGGGAAGVTEAYWQFYNTTAAGSVTVGVYSGSSGGSGSSGSGSSSGGSSGASGGSVSLTGTRYASSANSGATGYFADFSALLRLKGSEVQFVNFVIAGANSRRVFIRAAGPSLTRMNVSDYAPKPKLELYTGTGGFWAAGTTPVTDAATISLGNSLGALTLASGDADSALVTTLTPGSYVIAVWDAAGTGGAVMTELFEADGNVPARLVAFSSRGGASTNTGTQTVEFTIKGSSNQGVLVRALGPALAAQSLSGGNSDPTLQIQNSSGTTVATNDNWETPTTTSGTSGATATQLSTIATNVGAAALTAGSKDAAIYISLAPGSYTASVAGVNSATGFTELEIYEVPATTGTSSSGTTGTTTNNTNSASSSSGSGGGGAPAPWAAGLLALALLWRAHAQRARR